jgi:hypothetical protein
VPLALEARHRTAELIDFLGLGPYADRFIAELSTVTSSFCCTRLINGPNASASRCATPAVGSSRRITRGATASTDASSTIRRAPADGNDGG